MVDTANLRVEIAADRRTCSYVGLHNVANYLDSLPILKAGRVLIRLRDNGIPLGKKISIYFLQPVKHSYSLIWIRHQFLD